MKPLVLPDEIEYQACGKVDRKPLPTFPQALLLRLLWPMSPQKGDISTLEKRGHFYFGLTVENGDLLAQSSRVPFVQS
jgi:hypothetical protein